MWAQFSLLFFSASEQSCAEMAEVSKEPKVPLAANIGPRIKRIEKGTTHLLTEFKRYQMKADEDMNKVKEEDRVSFDKYTTKRYREDIVCLETNRVKLDDSMASEDYIHASYIDGFDRKKAYIATQIPDQHTVVDFWRMVWHTNASLIVSLTNLRDPANQGAGCWFYWPLRPTEIYRFGHIMVHNLAFREEEHWVETSLEIVFCNKKESRKLTHLVYTEWDEDKAPRSVDSLRRFRKKMRAIADGETLKKPWWWPPIFKSDTKPETHTEPPPIVVQCTTGAGRSGSLILLDICLEGLKKSGRHDLVDEMMLKLREQRPGAVAKENQYICVWLAVLMEALEMDKNLSIENLAPFRDGVASSLPRTPFLPRATTDKTQETDPKLKEKQAT